MTQPDTATPPITIEQLATLIPAWAKCDTATRNALRAEWTADTTTTTAGTTWSISAHWHPTRPARIAILGPAAAVILDDPTATAVRAHLDLLGAI